MSAHTPGPWTFEPREYRSRVDPKEVHCLGIFGADGEEIVVTDSGYYPPKIADAYLIAAAPELLAVAKQLVRVAELLREANACPLGIKVASVRAQAAIAKAEGR